MPLHAALQDYVNCCCREVGLPQFELARLPTYAMVYADKCSKLGMRRGDGGRRYIAPNMSFTRESLYKMCRTLLAGRDPLDARNLSIILYQIATVARGDDVRPRKLIELSLRYMAAIGESALQTGVWLTGWLVPWRTPCETQL